MRNPNGYGGVTKLPGNRRNPFQARVTDHFTPEGLQKYRIIGYYPDRKAALMALAAYNENPCVLGTESLTFEDVYQLWFSERFKEESMELHGHSKASMDAYSAAFRNSAVLSKKKFHKLKISDLQQIMNACELRKNSRNNIKMLWSAMYRYAIKSGIVNKNQAEYIDIGTRKADGEAKVQRTVFTPDEMSMLTVYEPENEQEKTARSIALIMLYSGMRISEVLTLKRENIHLPERYLIGGIKTAAGRDRTIPIHKRLVPIFQELQAENKLPFAEMNYKKFIKNNWVPFMAALGMQHQPHDCRHTCASMLDSAKANPITVKRILGHASSNVTEHYIHKALPELLEAIDLIL